ncbi:outer membrane beta-barrel protein, partial [Escherichia coli]
PKTSIICSPMTSLKTSIKTITYLSDIGCLEIQGASLLMLNAYYDFRNDSAFTPWVSAGIGYARIHQKTTGISTWDYGYGSSGRESLSRSGSADNFAWSLGAGVRYDVTPDIALDLSYRYLDAGDSSVSYKDEWGDKYKSEVDVKSHDILLGVTYNF